MKFIIFSDLHAHPYKEYSTSTSEGLNSRLQDTLNVLQQILDYCRIPNTWIDDAFFLGDLFHQRGRIHVETFNKVYGYLEKLADYPGLHLIAGNHDFTSKALNESVLKTLRKIANVYEKPATLIFDKDTEDEVVVDVLPYCESVEGLKFVSQKGKKYTRLLLGHVAVYGAVVGPNEFKPESPIKLPDLQLSRYWQIFLGHYHKKQQLRDNTWYVGSTLQQNWGERGNDNSFFVVDTKRKTVEQIPIKGPKFILLDEINGIDNDVVMKGVKGNFLRVLCREEDYHEKMREEFLERGALSVEFEIVPKVESVSRRLDIKLDSSWGEIIKKYVENLPTVLNKPRLVKLGLEIFKEEET